MSQLQVTGEAKIRAIQGPVVANSGVITALDGVASQYVRGDGTLANFPTSGGGGGGSISYYLNGSVNQGNINGSVYYQMSKTPVIGAGTNFSVSNNDLIAQFITDANDPSLLEIPAGNWNFEMFFSASSNGGTPSFYVQLFKYNTIGGFTLISSSSANPEGITNGTAIDLYTTALAVPSTVLSLTDRLMIRVFVNNSGRTITLHTEASHLCQVITTFSTGITALNGLTKQVQFFAVGTSGSDFNIVSSGATHTFNIPSADGSNRGLVTTGTQSFGGNKSFGGTLTAANLNVSGVLTVFGNLSNGTYSYTLPSANGQLALTSQIPSISGSSYRVIRYNVAGTNIEGGSIYDDGNATGSPTGQVEINSRLRVNNFTELNRYLTIVQNTDPAFVPPTTGVNLELFFNTESGIVGYAPDSAYIRARKASDDSLKRLFVLGSELILNQTTTSKTLINKQGATQTTTKLEVAGYARFDNSINVIGALYLNATDASQPTYIQAPSGNVSLVTTGTILLRSGINTGLYVDTTGYVGINGATPTVPLTVNGAGLITGGLTVNGLINNTYSNNTFLGLNIRNTSTGDNALSGLSIQNAGGTTVGQINYVSTVYANPTLRNTLLINTVFDNKLAFGTNSGGGETRADIYFTVNPAFTLDVYNPNQIHILGTSRNVIINYSGTDFGANFQVNGTTRLSAALSVIGAATFSSSIAATSATFSDLISTSYGTARIQVTSTTNSANSAFRLGAKDSAGTTKNAGLYYVAGTTTATTFLSLVADDNNYQFNVLANGNVGIATTSTGFNAAGLPLVVGSGSGNTGLTIFSGASSAGSIHFADAETTGSASYSGYINYDHSGNSMQFGTGASERIRITSAGNVGIGTSSPSQKLVVIGGNGNQLTLDNTGQTYTQQFWKINGSDVGTIWASTSEFHMYTYGTQPILFSTNNTERMRITSDGKLLVGTSTAGYGLFTNQRMTLNPTNDGITVAPLTQNKSAYTLQADNNTGNRYALYIANGSSNEVGSVSFTSTLVSFNVTSDYRLKQDLKEFDGLYLLSKIKTYDYEWKSDNSRMYGVLAHELSEVLPYAVIGEKDALNENGTMKTQGVDYSKIVPILVKAIQEQQAQIEELKTKIK